MSEPVSAECGPVRRMKREKSVVFRQRQVPDLVTVQFTSRSKRQSKTLQKHGKDAQSGGITSMLPSLIGVAILVCGVMAKMGFRGRASVAGIDLGTTNSVICVQKLDKGVGEIQCISDPASNSPIIPSVVSFLEPWERKVGPSSKLPSLLNPHPSHVIVGSAAKRRIDSHPHHTLYQAKRVLGRPASDPAIDELRAEVEFGIHPHPTDTATGVYFRVPDTPLPISPEQVGAYVVHHLIQVTKAFLGHDNVKSAVICVPAKFDDIQRQKTYDAFLTAGIRVLRVLEEPTAAALAYGLHRKEGVDYILVYDFGGGTLDVSLLHVSDGFVEVMGSDGDDRLGGADFDAAVAHQLLQHHGGQAIVDRVADYLQRLQHLFPGVDLEDRLASDCPRLIETPLCTASSFHTIGEQLKIELSSFVDGDGEVSAQCLAPDEGTAQSSLSIESFCKSLQPLRLSMTSAEYDLLIQPLLNRSILPIERLINDLEIKKKEIDEVVMVGGTTRMPQIRQLVRKALPESQLNTGIDPDITVAYGAASVID